MTTLEKGQRVLAMGQPATVVLPRVSDRVGYPSPHAEVDYDNGDLNCHVPVSLIQPMSPAAI